MAATEDYRCPECDGGVREANSDTYECETCGERIPAGIVENADLWRALADTDLQSGRVARQLIGGER